MNSEQSESGLYESRVPLLNVLEPSYVPHRGDENDEPDIDILVELWELCCVSFPVALGTAARLVIVATDAGFVGRLFNPEAKVTGISLANTWTGFLTNVIFCPGYALNSLCSQAIGAGNPKLAGVWLQLAIFVSAVLCIPVLFGYRFTWTLINFVSDDEEKKEGIPEYAQTYNDVSMLLLLPMVAYMTIRQYFQAMQIVLPAMIVSGLTVGVNFIFNYIFVPEGGIVGWGYLGSPFATFLSMIFQLISFLLYTCIFRGYHKPYWDGWSWSFLSKVRVKRFFKMLIPMAMGSVIENSGLQFISIANARIGTDNLAALQTQYTLWGIMWAFYWGIGLALQVRVGAKLGEGSVKGAKMVAKVSIVLAVSICTIASVIMYIFRTDIAYLLIKSDRVVPIVADSMYAMIINFFVTCLGLCLINILEAMAQNLILAITLSVGTWFVSVPLSLIFAYKVPLFENDKVVALWHGQTCGEFAKLVVLLVYLFRLDWQKICNDAKERSEMLSPGVLEDNEEHFHDALDESLPNDTMPIVMQQTRHRSLSQSFSLNVPSPSSIRQRGQL